MKKYIYIVLLTTTTIFSYQDNLLEKRSDNLGLEENRARTFRTGDYGLVCQNESGSYNPDMSTFIHR